MLARLVVFKNGQKTIGCSINEDYCEFDAKENDHIDIKLKFLDTTTLTVASFVCQGESETVYISPTNICRNWELAIFRILPGLCCLALLLKIVTRADTYEWLFTGIIVLNVLALICFQFFAFIPFMRKRLFKFDSWS